LRIWIGSGLVVIGVITSFFNNSLSPMLVGFGIGIMISGL